MGVCSSSMATAETTMQTSNKMSSNGKTGDTSADNGAPDTAVTGSPKPVNGASQIYDKALATSMRDASSKNTSLEEYSLAKVKERLLLDWHPEYEPESILPPHEARGDVTVSERATLIQLEDIAVNSALTRKTKVVCTLGPACGTPAMLGKLINAGLNIARLNFSHGDHVTHAQMLQLFRDACKEKGAYCATMLDTKGPEIRTAMLRGGKIALEAGQSVIIEAVGDKYTEFQGYKTAEETRIGLSYPSLCQSVSNGSQILLADGSITIRVERILSATEIQGTVLNSKELGQRKNCSLPGIHVDLPVLAPNDINDVQNFACKHGMDFIAASFVQCKEDVDFIRSTLNAAGGHQIGIISKIENLAGLQNIDAILEASDGIMVARGDLGMDIPSEKVTLAQKMIITKCNIAGKFVICATQMLESMVANAVPTRAEMTDCANAVYDGADAVMLSGETANGAFPERAVGIMADIVANAEVGVDYYKQFNFIRYWSTKQTTRPLSDMESVMCSAATMAVLYSENTNPNLQGKSARKTSCIACLTESGVPARLIAKYRPPVVVFCISTNEATVRQANAMFALHGIKVDSLQLSVEEICTLAQKHLQRITQSDAKGAQIVVVAGRVGGSADMDPVVEQHRVRVGGLYRRLKSFGVALTTAAGTPLAAVGTRSMRSTLTNLSLIQKPAPDARTTNIICTAGPACSSVEAITGLINAGCDILRFDFSSNTTHEEHLARLQNFREACKAKAAEIKQLAGMDVAPLWATMVDIKGPEVCTALLRDGKSIMLEKDQKIVIEAVGDKYTTFKGYKTSEETRIGLSYAGLCSSVAVGHQILLDNGAVTIVVDEILSSNQLRGTVQNSKELGEMVNCNLPGAKLKLPVLTDKDVRDLEEFVCKHKVDFVAAPLVQSFTDVKSVRAVLDSAGGFETKIIAKIENQEGLNNYDEILREADGVMVARGSLGREISPSKVPLAQKMMITKANLAAKFVICSTEMLESMIANPRPTRAEMTDTANAVIDGADTVMLCGETANGKFPVEAVSTMAAIVQNTEHIVDKHRRYNFIRANTPVPMDSAEAIASSAVEMALDMKARAIICFTVTGRSAPLLAKYRPPMQTFIVSPEDHVVKACRAFSCLQGIPMEFQGMEIKAATNLVIQFLEKSKLLVLEPKQQIVVVSRRTLDSGRTLDDQRLAARAMVVGDEEAADVEYEAAASSSTMIYRSTKIGLDTVLDQDKFKRIVRKTKIVCTIGPACSSEDMMQKLIGAGMNIARLNFSHGTHASHLEVLERLRGAAAKSQSHLAFMLDTKGPEIRTAMLRQGKNIQLQKGQKIVIEAVGDHYTEFEGFQTEAETRIGISYEKLCQSVAAGGRILLADGSITVVVDEILSPTELRGTVQNTKELGQRKNVNLPGVKVDLPVLLDKDIDDLQNFGCKHGVDFVAASFVQSKADVLFIRSILDKAGGHTVKIISKIENTEGLRNYDEILDVTDGIMVARGDLGMDIPLQKVPLAQKLLIAKANIAGKFAICATQMMESMITARYPTRAEMTDVANAVFDGADGVMLSGETANGVAPAIAVSVMSSITQYAEIGVNNNQTFNFIRSFTPKPVGMVEAAVSTMAKNAVDIKPGMLIVFSESGKMARLVAKYRPCAPVLVVTSNVKLARACSAYYACYPMLLPEPMANKTAIFSTLKQSLRFGVEQGLCVPGKEVVVLASTAVTASGVGKGTERELFVTLAPGKLQFRMLGTLAPNVGGRVDDAWVAKTITMRSARLDLEMILRESKVLRKTKIIGTAGPSSSDKETLKQMVLAGMDVFRINLAHADHATASATIDTYRAVCKELGTVACVFVDLQGSELRSSWLIDQSTRKPVSSVSLTKGQEIVLVGSADQSPETFVGWSNQSETRISVGYGELGKVAKEDTIIRMADGAVEIKVEKILSQTEVLGRVASDCVLGSHKIVSIAALDLKVPFLTEKDKDDAQWAAKIQADFIAATFARCKENIEELQDLMYSFDSQPRIIAKIADSQGLKNIDTILEVCSGVVISRGDLGLEIGPEKVALAQNLCVSKAKVRGKVSIVSRQVLASMVQNPRPTRAEMTDVANAIFESADAIILGDETANGQFVVKAVETMASIARNAEEATNYYALHSFTRDFSSKPFTTLEAACSCLARTTADAAVSAVLTCTENGYPAQIVCKFRPQVPHIVLTSKRQLAAACSLYFGMVGVQLALESKSQAALSVEDAVKFAIAQATRRGAYTGGKVAVLHGTKTLSADDDGVLSVLDPSRL